MNEEKIIAASVSDKPSDKLVLEKKKISALSVILIVILSLLVISVISYYMSSRTVDNNKNLPEPLRAGEATATSN